MSVPHIVTADDLTYQAIDELVLTYTVLVQGAVRDEVTGGPLHARVTASADHPEAVAKGFEGSLWCVAGYAEQVFPTLPASLTVTLSAPGYRNATVTLNLPSGTVFPFDGGTVLLRPDPVRMQGRVVEVVGARNPIAGAAVTAANPNLLLLRTPVHLDHTAGVAVRQRALNPAGSVKQLTAAALGGSTRLTLTNTTGVVANAVLQLGTDRDAEYVVVTAADPVTGNVDLAAPLRRSLAAGATVQRVTKGALGASQTLSRDALAGDGLLVLSGSLPDGTVEVFDGGNSEYAVTGALTDARGYYRLDGVGGVVALDLQAAAPTYVTQEVSVVLDYAAPVNITDFRLAH